MLLKKPKPTPEANLKTGFPYEINTLLHCCFLGNQNQVGQLHHTSYSWSLDYLEHVPWIYLVVPQNTDNSQSWSYPILDQKKKKKKKNPFHLIKVKTWESEFLPLPLGRATPDRASRTELFPELWSPITAIAGKDRSFSIPRALRLSTRSMQGRIFSTYWLYKVCSAAC